MKKTNWKLIIFFFVVPIILQCFYSISIGDIDACTEKELSERVYRYFELEKKGLWSETYEYRTPLYKKSISKKFYIERMKEDNQGWELVDFKPIECRVQNNYAIFLIEFVEKVPEGYFSNSFNELTKIKENTTWEKIKGIWYVRDAGDRIHLSLNGDMVMRDDQKPISIDR